MEKDNLRKLINISDDICALSVNADKLNFLICSLLGKTKEAKDNYSKLFIYPNLVTFAEIALDYICKVNKDIANIETQINKYIDQLKSQEMQA